MKVKVEDGKIMLIFRDTKERDILEINGEYETEDCVPGCYTAKTHALGILCERVTIYPKEEPEDDSDNEEFELSQQACILCGVKYTMGEDGNELGFCSHCQKKDEFPYDIDAYYKAYDKGEEIFKGVDTMSRGILEKYRKTGLKV